MEELQDAIEDAQYVNAISTQDDGPRPVLAWEIPTLEQLATWKDQLNKDKNAFSLEWTLHSAMGLFLFSAFLKEDNDDYLRINFCEDIIRWRRMKGKQRVEKAKTISTTFLADPKPKEEEGVAIGPPTKKLEIDEYDLERHIPDIDDLQALFEANFDSNYESSCVGLTGEVREAVFSQIADVEQARLAHRKEKEKMKSDTTEESTTIDTNDDADVDADNDIDDDNDHDADGLMNGDHMMDDDAASHDDEDREEAKYSSTELGGLGLTKATSSHFRLINKKPESGPRYLPDDFFDNAEAVVMESLRIEYWAQFLESDQYRKLMNFLWYQDRKVVAEDFFVMRVLGRGGFGLVTACKKGTSGKLYAMKVMNKRRIKMKKSEQLALCERVALAAVESPFVVNLKYSFQSKEDVFLILDLMTGGDLGYHLHQKGRFPRKECLYYAARIMLGLQALHDKKYVYRDLKPENCLLADDGRVKITDLGLATKITPNLHGAAGTRGYWAPEMLRRDKKGKRMPYGHTVDWFSFGCCLAEFISGQNPFRSEAALNFGLERGKQSKVRDKKAREKAIDCATLEMEPSFDSDKFDEDAADLCKRLLDKNERTRIGTSGCHDIMAHPWFKDVVWEYIISDRKKPPFTPPKDVNAASQSEIGTFAEDKAYQDTVIEDKDDTVYKDWDWTNRRAFAAEVIEVLIYERETGEPLVPAPPHGTCCCVIS